MSTLDAPDRPTLTPGFPERIIGWVLAGGSAVGTAAAFALLLDRISLWKDPAFVPACSINPVLSCGSVMTSPQSEVLGFPNPLIGLVAFPVVATIGVVVLAGARLPRWVWVGLQAGSTVGMLFVHWLIAQSLYVIGALCPYCMAVWVVTITVFWYTTLCNVAAIRASGRTAPAAVRFATTYHSALLVGWLVVVASLIAVRFGPVWTGMST